eukprot:gene8653-10153_t
MKKGRSVDDSYEEDFEFDFEEEEEDDTSSTSAAAAAATKKRKAPASASSKKAAGKPHPPVQQLPYTDRVFVVPHYPLDTQDDHMVIFSIPHPKTLTESRFIIDVKNNVILEIERLQMQPSSWFIDNGVRHDGSLYVTSYIDPLFLLIPFFEKSRSKTKDSYCGVSSLRADAEYSVLGKSGYKVDLDQLELICDRKMVMDESMFRLDDDKLLLWLRCKTRALLEHLKLTNDIGKSSFINVRRTDDYVHKYY